MSFLEHFNLNEQPFALTPDPGFVYWSKQHARAKAYMESTILLADGFVVITGEIGSGKTTLLQSFLGEIEDDIVCALVSQTQLKPTQFLQAVLAEFGFKPFDKHKVELLHMLNMFLIEQYSNGKKVILIIDEAQNLSKKVLEEIRLLSGIETHKEKTVRIILAGQPELNETLDSPRLKQLVQRVRLRFHIGPLDDRAMREYIEHRLKVAGSGNNDLIADDAFAPIYRYTGGIPRLINMLCDTALLCAFAEDKQTVDTEDVMSAVKELNWKNHGAYVRCAAQTSEEFTPIVRQRRGGNPRRTMLIAPNRGNLHKIVVLNPKGGCGKTTLATNIAAYYAMRGPAPTLVDLDSQGFSMRWLDRRPSDRPKIHGSGAYQQSMQGRDTVHLQTRPDTENLIIDLPAALSPDEFQDVTYDAGSILIPVLPSNIDVNCASQFIADLLLVAQIDRRNRQLAVVANRTRQNTKSYQMLLRFLTTLQIPLIAVLRDSQNYVHAAGQGIGICEMPAYNVQKDIPQLKLIVSWLDQWRIRQLDAATSPGFQYLPGAQVLTSANHQKRH